MLLFQSATYIHRLDIDSGRLVLKTKSALRYQTIRTNLWGDSYKKIKNNITEKYNEKIDFSY